MTGSHQFLNALLIPSPSDDNLCPVLLQHPPVPLRKPRLHGSRPVPERQIAPKHCRKECRGLLMFFQGGPVGFLQPFVTLLSGRESLFTGLRLLQHALV